MHAQLNSSIIKHNFIFNEYCISCCSKYFLFKNTLNNIFKFFFKKTRSKHNSKHPDRTTCN